MMQMSSNMMISSNSQSKNFSRRFCRSI